MINLCLFYKMPTLHINHYYTGKVSECFNINLYMDNNEYDENNMENFPYNYNIDMENLPYNIIYHTDRLSAFNRNICVVKGKGYQLARQNEFWMKNTKHLVPNHYIKNYGNATLVHKCIPIKLEIIIRQCLSGSLWKHYEKGNREYYGHVLKEDMTKNQRLDEVIITPTNKDETDTPISYDDIINQKILSKDELDYIYKSAKKLFSYGQDICSEKGLLLADAKYEFGYCNNKIILIDEIHTSDSCRIWDMKTYQMNQLNPHIIINSFDKDIARNYINQYIKNNNDVELKDMDTSLIKKNLIDGYIKYSIKLMNFIEDNSSIDYIKKNMDENNKNHIYDYSEDVMHCLEETERLEMLNELKHMKLPGINMDLLN